MCGVKPCVKCNMFEIYIDIDSDVEVHAFNIVAYVVGYDIGFDVVGHKHISLQ